MSNMPGGWDYEEDEWHEQDYHRGQYGYTQPPPPRAPPRRSGDLLAPVADYSGSSLRRSRSHGHSPAPNIYVYNRTDVDNHEPSPSPGPARGRRDDRLGLVVDRLDDIGRDVHRISRSRDAQIRTAVSPGPNPWEQQRQYEEHMRLQQANAQIVRLESERRAQHEYLDRQREEELYRKQAELEKMKIDRRANDSSRWDDREKFLKEKMKLKALQDEIDKIEADAKGKEQRDRILLENERAMVKAKVDREKVRMELKMQEDEEEEERKKLIAEAEAKAAKRKKAEDDAEKAAVARWEAKRAAEKKQEEAMRLKFKMEEDERKRKEKEEEEEWVHRLKMKKEKEKEEEKKRQQEIDEALHKKMAVFGFQENQIQAVLDPKKAQNLPAGYAPSNPRPAQQQSTTVGVWTGHHATPTYIKVSREHLDIETLKYYNLRYEIDTVCEASSGNSVGYPC